MLVGAFKSLPKRRFEKRHSPYCDILIEDGYFYIALDSYCADTPFLVLFGADTISSFMFVTIFYRFLIDLLYLYDVKNKNENDDCDK